MKRFYQDYNRVRIYQVKQLLEDAAIPCMVKNELIQGAAGEIPLNEAMPEIWLLDDEWEDRATKLLSDFEHDLDLLAVQSEWRCKQCATDNEANFAICWQCEQPRPQS